MKINFDTIQKDIAYSFESTLASSFILPADHVRQQHSKRNRNHEMTHSLLVGSKSFLGRSNPVSKFFQKPQSTSISNSNVSPSVQKITKLPKKFSNLKTIQDMQSFINQMNHNESTHQLKPYSKITKNLSFDQSTFNKTLAIANINSNPKAVKDKRQKVERVTSRLYQTFKDNNKISSFCKRNSCKAITPSIVKIQAEDMKNFTGQPNIDRIKKSKDLSSKLYHSLDTSIDRYTCEESTEQIVIKDEEQVHERLFKDFKLRKDLKQSLEQNAVEKCIQLSRSLENKNKEHSLGEKQLSASRGFYQRLGELSQRLKNRPKLCQLVYSKNSFLHQNKYYKKHRSTYQDIPLPELQKLVSEKASILSKKPTKCTKSKCHHTEEHLKSQQFIHFQQIPQINDKTKQIMQQNENELLKRLKALFYEKKSKKVKVNSAKIYTLSQREFGILFELIRKVQQKSNKAITQKKLDQMIAKFYHGLGFSDKQQLRRNHMLFSGKVKNKVEEKEGQSQMIKQTANKNKSDKRAKQTDKNITDCSSFDSEVDYCARLAMYV